MTQSVDIRVSRTKELLKSALIELMQSTNAKCISVRALTANAKVSRVTFYRHYQGMQDFLIQTIDSSLQGLFIELDSTVFQRRDRAIEYYTAFFDHVKENSQLFSAMLGPNGIMEFRKRFTAVRRKYHQNMMANFRREFHSSADDDVLFAYFSGVLLSLIEFWLTDEGSKHSSTYMAQQICKIAHHHQVLRRLEN